ncbi:MAG: universal stress protein, partial [Anaerolineales bacterium]|nr:universal stress protein [Anaerolineales bacterium]
MGMILCATRGGEASYRTQDAVIALAQKQGDELVFLYVVDISFLNKTAAPMVIDVQSRLEKLGQFQLVMAKERAEAQGVLAQTIVRKGQLRAELSAVAKEFGATLIVMGHSLGPDAAFEDASLRAFAA